ncbi:MAG: aldo/keto reductase [Clostridia bacterium]|nr:aldo/keto reductase [Clostridia bacterium]
MKYIELGKTGLKPSVISFGGIPIQRGSQETAKAVLDKCMELGINYIDTARGYSVSEEYIGNAIEGNRDKWILATKSMVRDYESMKNDIETSLKNLKTDYIDLYQIHNIKTEEIEQIFSENGPYRALVEAKEAGKIGHIGVTVHAESTLKILFEEYSDKYETIMFPYNMVETQGTELLRKARAMGIGTIAMKPFAGGNLTNHALCLRFIAESETMDIAIPGMGDVAEAEEDASVEFSPLTAEELAEVEETREKLGTQFCRRCGYCAPCTVGIPINHCFTMKNYMVNYGLADWAIPKYEAFAAHAGDCIECGVCETRCPYNLPIRQMLKEVKDVFGK